MHWMVKPKPWSEVVTDPLRRVRSWGLTHVSPRIAWPVELQMVIYRGDEIWVLPATTDRYPGVALYFSELSYKEAGNRLLRFLSALSWSERGGITAIDPGGGGSHLNPRPLDRPLYHSITGSLRLENLPSPCERGALALALMREGRSLESVPYAFLTFYRLVELAVPAKKRREWIASALEKVSTVRAIEAVRHLQRSGLSSALEAADHLYISGRMAIAHAKADADLASIISPDDLSQSERLSNELAAMEALAERAIIECFDIPEPR
ncbi:hypothetical protein OLX23_12505 [Novosphingobium sp. JCM 18896]|nr:hypothetical protein [Novosphingobium sp. JCM 18896]